MKTLKLFKNIKKMNIKSKITKKILQKRNMSHHIESYTIPYKYVGCICIAGIFGSYMYYTPHEEIKKDNTEKNNNKKINFEKELYNAICNSNHEEIKFLLENEAINVNYALNGKTLLYKAIDIYINHNGYYSVSDSQKSIIELLLKHGANPNKKIVSKYDYIMPLALAIKKNEYDIVKLLLKYGADPNLPIIDGHNCIEWIVKENHFKIFKLLIDNKVTIDKSNVYSLLYYCMKYDTLNNMEMTECLLNRITEDMVSEINKKDWYGDNLLNCAIISHRTLPNKIKIIKSLVDKKVDTNCIDKYGNSSLSLAVRTRELEIVNLLITSGANITSDVINKIMLDNSSIKYDALDILLNKLSGKAKIDCMQELLLKNFNVVDLNSMNILMIKVFVKHGVNIGDILLKIDNKDNIPQIKDILDKILEK